MNISELKDKKVAILGFGEEGQSTAQFLENHGIRFSVFDVRHEDQLDQEKIEYFRKKGVNFRFDSYPDDFSAFDLVVRSPGVSVLSAVIEKIKKRGIEVTSAIKIFFDLCPCPIIGVTGTKGKSTTSTLIYEMLKKGGIDAFLGGNIGTTPLEFLDELKSDSKVVLELSSFQLQDLHKSPQIGVVLMVTSEHLDYHRDTNEYIEAKRNILRFQTSYDFAILNRDYPASNESDIHTGARIYKVSREGSVDQGCFVRDDFIWLRMEQHEQKVMPVKDVLLPGKHNLENVCAAVMAARLSGVQLSNIISVLEGFKGLPHRLEFVGEHHGIRFFNDSLATIPAAAIEGIEALGDDVETIIAGGHDRGSDYTELGSFISSSKIKTLILFPSTGERIWNAVCEAVPNESLRPKKYDANSMKEAVIAAYENTDSGKICLMSPGSASFGMFENYKDRGDQFKKEVEKLQ